MRRIKEGAPMTWERLVAGVLAVSVGTGCYSTWDVPHAQLRKLDGYRPPKVVTLQDDQGDKVAFDSHASIVAVDERGKSKRFRVDSAKVVDDNFYAFNPNQGVLRIPLERDRTITIKKYDSGMTGLAIAGASVGGIAIAVAMLYTFSTALRGY